MSTKDLELGDAARPPLARRLAIAGTILLQLCAQGAADDAAGVLVTRAAEKNAAFMTGDMKRWAELVALAPDFTLMEPFGGAASHGFDMSEERLAKLAGFFRDGRTALAIEQVYASGTMIVLVMIEQQTAAVGGLPLQDWSLRVTEVYRNDGGAWLLVHRHADPLVRRRTLEETARLARGLAE